MAKKPVHISEKHRERILMDMARGIGLIPICLDLGITRDDVSKYCEIDPFFAKEIQRVRVNYIHDEVDSLRTIADNLETMVEVNAARLKSDNIKWSASKIIPHIYGDSMNLNINHSLDISLALAQADARVIPLLEMKRTPLPKPSEISDVEEAEEVESIEELL